MSPSSYTPVERGSEVPELEGPLIRLQPRRTTIYVSHGRTVLATDSDGFISNNGEHGLWVYQTRMLSRYRWLIGGKPPKPSVNSDVQQHSWLGYYITAPPNARQTRTGETDPAQETVELRVTRSVSEGMHEDVDVTNFTQIGTEVLLELEVDSDFADPHEARQGKRMQKGKLSRHWSQTGARSAELDYDYRAEHKFDHQGEKGVARIHRGIQLKVENAGSKPDYSDGRVRFRVKLPPQGTWHACLTWIPSLEGKSLQVGYSCSLPGHEPAQHERKRVEFLREAAEFTAPRAPSLTEVVLRSLDQARRDLFSLRLFDLDKSHGGWVTAAGLPAYLALFGRDTLITAWQALLLGPEMAIGTLEELARWQGSDVSRWRDEQPGKIIHEKHTSPLAELNFSPHGRYYGGVTGAMYYGAVLAELWHSTGDPELIRPLIPTALKGLEWADKYADLDGDGLYEYLTLSEKGEKNQGWKDSDDAIVYEDGAQVEDPLGTCEMQSFVYTSKLQLSEVLWWMGEKGLSRKLYLEAEDLKKRFNEKFWMEDEGFVAMGLDSKKRLIRSVASDPGHCLATGILDGSRAERVAMRLMADDMFSGWGIRTLSARHPAFNPYAYHRGTVWPSENGVFSLAFSRHGLFELAHDLCRAQFEAAAMFEYFRLPECMAGHPRDSAHPFPGLYPRANWPQAWSCSSLINHMRAILRLYPYAPMQVLLLDPHLPDWLPEITVRKLRVGPASVDLRFRRNPDGDTEYEIIDIRGSLHVVRHPNPSFVTAAFGESIREELDGMLSAR